MFVSGVVATLSLLGILVAALAAAAVLAFIDKSYNKNRKH
jgi:hypothetical protein